MFKRFLLVATCLVVLVLAAGPADSETFELHVWGYCDYGTYCGHGDFQTYKLWVLDTVHWLNIIFEPTGISFNPQVLPVLDDSYYSEVEGCQGNSSTVNYQRRQEWRTSVAANAPQVISIMITAGPHLCCSPVPDDPAGNPVEDLGLFCDVNRGSPKANGFMWAHEMAHHWGLPHPFSLEDKPDVDPTPPDYDHDGCCVPDTPGDPGPYEYYREATSGRDQAWQGAPTTYRHEYCNALPLSGLTDDGSPHSTLCVVSCFEQGLLGPELTDFRPLSNLVVSYYGSLCTGPFVVNGRRTEAFSQGSLDRIQWVLDTIPSRFGLTDVCEANGYDVDRDGICQDWDNCPQVRNTAQRDKDFDDIGDVCDMCPDDPVVTGDMDYDGIGDVCDPNTDGDSCDNDLDQNPDESHVVVGSYYDPTCDPPTQYITEWESNDSDIDYVPNCLDVDDDNDGICDEDESWSELAPGAPLGGCIAGPDSCPLEAGEGCHTSGIGACLPRWAAACSGPGCMSHYVRFTNVSNPDPTSELIFDRVQIINEELFLGSPLGDTLSEAGMALQGGAPAAAAREDGRRFADTLRLELWETGHTDPVAVIAEYTADSAIVGDVTRGALLAVKPAIDPTSGGQMVEVRAVYSPGVDSDDSEPDQDGDGRPDAWDNCLANANFLQTDADGDGYGNACDGDLDGDGVVDAGDVAAVLACEGADLTLEMPVGEPEFWVDGTVLYDPDVAAIIFAAGCRAADLNDDGKVDSLDSEIAIKTEGTSPGPSAQVDPELVTLIFGDGFESGDTRRWSVALP